jgi:hypothetical protein
LKPNLILNKSKKVKKIKNGNEANFVGSNSFDTKYNFLFEKKL